eukprot:242213-Pleurochrysis_carterae.AAC.1
MIEPRKTGLPIRRISSDWVERWPDIPYIPPSAYIAVMPIGGPLWRPRTAVSSSHTQFLILFSRRMRTCGPLRARLPKLLITARALGCHRLRFQEPPRRRDQPPRPRSLP